MACYDFKSPIDFRSGKKEVNVEFKFIFSMSEKAMHIILRVIHKWHCPNIPIFSLPPPSCHSNYSLLNHPKSQFLWFPSPSLSEMTLFLDKSLLYPSMQIKIPSIQLLKEKNGGYSENSWVKKWRLQRKIMGCHSSGKWH